MNGFLATLLWVAACWIAITILLTGLERLDRATRRDTDTDTAGPDTAADDATAIAATDQQPGPIDRTYLACEAIWNRPTRKDQL